MAFVTDYQLVLLLGFFLAGLTGTALIFRRPAGSRAWKLADLVWVVLGGFGALTAVLAGIYTNDSSRLDRQIDIAYALTSDFDRDAARFRLRNCEGQPAAQVLVLCNKVEFLSASTAGNAELPLFLSITRAAAPLQGLNFLLGSTREPDMMDAVATFDPAPFLAFTTEDDATRAAMADLMTSAPGIAADYQVIAMSYDRLIAQVGRLKTEWEYLQDNAGILRLQIIALCLVAFAAPFRLGKSIVELR